jgi:sec-independent protein translocase protein TatB
VFDFAWSEIALIGIVALIAIGPKDLPVAIKAVSGMIKKARRMAAEFQTHVDELVREADLHEVRDQFRQIRNFDFRGEIAKAVDSDGSIRSTLSSNPLAPNPSPASPVTEQSGVVAHPENTIAAPHLAANEAPAFIPPADVATHESPPTEPPPAPAFIPPEYVPSDTHRT